MDTSTTSGISEGLKIALTAFAGVTVFVPGQIFAKWFIEPIQNQEVRRSTKPHETLFRARFVWFRGFVLAQGKTTRYQFRALRNSAFATPATC